MSLRALAERDSAAILADQSAFGWPVTVTSPDGLTLDTAGASSDISQAIDPDTGALILGRSASVALSIAGLLEAFGATPEGTAQNARKPWLVAFDDINGRACLFKVRQGSPDRALGVVVCHLEAYAA